MTRARRHSAGVIVEPLVLITMGLGVCLAAFVHATIGFGFGLVSMSILPFLVPIRFAVPMVTVFALCLNVVIILRIGAKGVWRENLPLLLGGVLGVPLGVWALGNVDPSWITRSLGAILVVYGLWSLSGRLGGGVRRRAWLSSLVGTSSGLLQGAFGTGGPPLVAYGVLTNQPKDTMTVTNQWFFMTASCLQVGLYVHHSMLGLEQLQVNLYLLPAIAIGGAIGMKTYDRIDRDRFQRIVLVVLVLLGITYLLR